MSQIVVDASVAVKWVVQENGTAQALAIRQGRQLIAPDLIVAECANILWKKVTRLELTVEQASLAARLLERVDIELLPMRRLLDAATKIAIDLDHAAYDCMYLAVALETGAPLVTADDRLLRKVRQERSGRFTDSVLSLSDAASGLGATSFT